MIRGRVSVAWSPRPRSWSERPILGSDQQSPDAGQPNASMAEYFRLLVVRPTAHKCLEGERSQPLGTRDNTAQDPESFRYRDCRQAQDRDSSSTFSPLVGMVRQSHADLTDPGQPGRVASPHVSSHAPGSLP